MSVAVRPETVTTAAPAAPPSSGRSFAAVVRSGLRSERRAPLAWGGGLGAMCALMAAMWPSISGSMQQLVKNYPSTLKEAFGIEALDTVEKYVDAEMLSLIIPLAMAFFAVRCATRMIVGAEDRGHLDALLSLPLSRRVLVAGSFVVTGVLLAASLAVMWAMTWITGTIAGTGISASTLAAGFANVWPLAMAFAGLAVFAAGILHRPGTVTAIATGTLVAMYVVDLVGKLASDLEPVRVVSAFRYYGSAIQDGIVPAHVLGLTAVAVVLAAAGAVLFDRRDVL
jgi:ABC-2 type transport system permease protein